MIDDRLKRHVASCGILIRCDYAMQRCASCGIVLQHGDVHKIKITPDVVMSGHANGFPWYTPGHCIVWDADEDKYVEQPCSEHENDDRDFCGEDVLAELEGETDEE